LDNKLFSQAFFLLGIFFNFFGLPLRPAALGRAMSWLAGLLGPAVFSLRSKTLVCGCAAPLSIPQPLIHFLSWGFFLRPLFFKKVKPQAQNALGAFFIRYD